MQAGRIVVGLTLFVVAVALLVNLPGARDRADDVQVLGACAVAVVAVAVWMWPWRKSLLVAASLLVAWIAAGFLIRDEGGAITVAAAGLLVAAGLHLRGLFRITLDDVRHDLAAASPVERGHALDRIAWLLREEYGAGTRDGLDLLREAARRSPHDDVRERAAALLRDLGEAPPPPPEPEAAVAPVDPPQEPDEGMVVDGDAPLDDDAWDEELADPMPDEEERVPPPLPTALAPGDPELVEYEGPPPPPTVDSLIAILRGGEPTPCRKAVAQLVALGERAVPALERAAAEGDADLRIDALEALRQIREELPS